MAELEKYQMYIGGEWTDPASGEWFESANPYTGKAWAEIPRGKRIVDKPPQGREQPHRGKRIIGQKDSIKLG